MVDAVALSLIAATFLLAGAVKGVIGLGLPTVSLGLLTATVGLHPAMALLLAPSIVTNLWQAAVGGNGRAILARLWPFLLATMVMVWVGALALTRVEVARLSALLGLLLVIYSLLNLAGTQFRVRAGHEPWLGPLAGTATGLLGGMTGSFVVPGVLYLQAIGLPRDRLIQAMGILFSAAMAMLALALGGNRILTVELGLVSTAAVVPALIGMALGQRLRQRLSERLFRRVLFLALLALGAYIMARSLT